MTTTIYQKYVPRYAETFTLISIDYGDDEFMEIVPHARVAKMSQEEVFDLYMELVSWQNEKASWED